MNPEFSRRLAKIASQLHAILGIKKYDELIEAAEEVKVFSKMSDWHKFLIRKAEKDVSH